MIKNIALKFGRGPGLEHAKITTTPITVFVGPNNSGKSLILSELNRNCKEGTKNINDFIIEDIEYFSSRPEEAEETISKITLLPKIQESVQPGHIIIGKGNIRHHIPKDPLVNALKSPNQNTNWFCIYYLAFNTIILDGKSRIVLINEQPAGDLQLAPTNSFQVLFRDDQKRKEVRRIIKDAFGSHFTIDPTKLGTLRIKLATRAPENNLEERGIHEEAVKFHASALPMELTSDGVKAFTGMITEIIAGDPKILLIDEPEAFLHPSLAYKLGKEISHAAAGTEKRIFVSTHSSNFVMGCIHSGTPVNIIRLTYQEKVATARILPNEDILKLMRKPLLRSTGILEGLFYEFVIVTESDTDRAFYEEINNRLHTYKPEWAIPNCLFINAQNKQTVQIIVKPLREMGINTVGIVDIDILKEGGVNWTNLLTSIFMPDIAHQPLSSYRAALKQKLGSLDLDMKRDGGIELLQDADKEAAINLFNQLDEYGLFVVRGGELESWLKQLQTSGHGPAWLIDIFEKMGEDPENQTYLKPADNDVWQFMSRIRNWFFNQERKGIPV